MFFFRPEAFLEYALFEEATGNLEHARELYETVLTKIAPGVCEGIVNFANFERRQGSLIKAAKIFDEGLATTGTEGVPLLVESAAIFHWRISGDAKRARAIFEDSISKAPESICLWLGYISFLKATESYEKVKVIFEKALSENSSVSKEDKMILAAQFLEYASGFATDVQELRNIQAAFPNVSNLLVFSKQRSQV